MIACNVKGYTPSCTANVGGVSRLFVGDANDFDFTETFDATTNDSLGYSAIEYRTGATAAGGAYLFEIVSVVDSISVEVDQSNPEGTSSEYAYSIKVKVAKFGQPLSNFARKLDAASICCQLVWVWVANDGTIGVAGEKYVNGGLIPAFRFKQDGSKYQSGLKFSDFNGGDLSIKGTYFRPPNEYKGGILGITPFFAP